MDLKFLTTREFDTWREVHDPKIDRILDFVEVQHALNIRSEQRLTTLEAQQEEAVETLARRTTWISSVVAAIVGGFVGWFSGIWP